MRIYATQLSRGVLVARRSHRRPRCVVIGAGIVGNSLVHHLAELGWSDIVQIDKGPLPNPGGSTGHASNFIFLTDHSREITDLTLDSVRAVQGDGRLHRVRRLRGGPHRGADGGAAPPDVLGQGVGHRGRAGRPRVRPGEGALPRQGPDHRRLLAAGGRRRRLAARRHDHARARAGEGRADRRAERRGHRPGGRPTGGSPRSAPAAATSRPRPSSSPAASGARRSATWPA